MTLRRFFTTLMALFIFSVGLSAQTQPTLDTSGLTAEQVNALKAAAEQLKKQPQNTLANLSLQTVTPDKFEEWANAGAAAGKAVSSFTKEIGIAADDFLKTDTGRISLYVLIWKLGGDKIATSLLNSGLNLILAIVLLTFWWRLTRRFVFNERRVGRITYNDNIFLRWLGFNKKEITYEKDESWKEGLDSEARGWILFLTRAGSAILLVIIVILCWPSISF